MEQGSYKHWKAYVSDNAAITPELKTSDGNPKHVPKRASLHRAVRQDTELKALARSLKPADGQNALEELEAMSKSGSLALDPIGPDRDHGSARHWLRDTEAREEAVARKGEQLLRAAIFREAEFQVSRSFGQCSTGQQLFKVLIAANTELAGWRGGRQQGPISFLYRSSKFQGAKFDGAVATHQEWGLFPGSTVARLAQGIDDVRGCLSSLNSRALEIRAWPMKMLATESDVI